MSLVRFYLERIEVLAGGVGMHWNKCLIRFCRHFTFELYVVR